MSQAVAMPVTIKSRIGIDERDSYEELEHFIATIANGRLQNVYCSRQKKPG